MTHPILRAHPEYAEWEQKVEAQRERRASIAAQQLVAAEKRRQTKADHETAIREAVERSEPIPPTPEPMDTSHLDMAMGVLRTEEEALRETRTEVLARVARDGGLTGVEDRLGAAQSRIASMAPELLAAQEDVHDTLRLARELMNAVAKSDGSNVRPLPGDRLRARWSVDDLLRAEVADLLSLRPVEPTGGTRIEAADDEEGRRRSLAAHNRLMAEMVQRETTGKRLGLTIERDRVGAFGARPEPAMPSATRPGEI